ncbi:bacteriorhodopsin [Haliscomenobacter sp.]|uniref:bacteriorhodopsin n=1 Tax=Haliscomenobacter sp. TaxID=2717303 RepID=UPI003364E240
MNALVINNFQPMFLAQLQPGDYVGFTFFIGSMAMLAATVFFFVQMTRVEGKWKDSLLVSALITGIAAAHYFYMRSFWAENQTSPTEFRYIDWILTVPLMCVEFYLILKPYGAKQGLMWRMIFWSVWMLVAGYLGETVFRSQSAIWGAISTIGYAFIAYDIWFGGARKLANGSADPNLQTAMRILGWFIFAGWAIYPLGYMAIEGGLLSGALPLKAMDLIYNIGDAVNKIGFGMVIYSLAISNQKGQVAVAA